MTSAGSTSKDRPARSKAKSGGQPSGRASGAIASLIAAPALWSILWPALLLIAGYVAWHQWGEQHVARKYYGIDASAIRLTKPPEYIRSDIIDTVYRDTDMQSMSLLDVDASSKIADAFATHPWVRRVIGVRKLSGGHLDIRLEYRQPVAMVHVISRHPRQGGAGFFAVDGQGVLLPTSDFSKAETNQYLHIIVPGAYPTGSVGAPFGDRRVEAAALLAQLLHPHRQELNLASIGIHGDARDTSALLLEVADAEDRRWFWGSVPGSESAGEPSAIMKLESLLAGAPPFSDLRFAHRTRARARPPR